MNPSTRMDATSRFSGLPFDLGSPVTPSGIAPLFDHTSIALLAIDDANAVAAISQAAQRLLGYPGQCLINEPAAMVLPILNQKALSAFERGRRSVLVRADGEPLQRRVTVIRLAVAEFSGWLVLIESLHTPCAESNPHLRAGCSDAAKASETFGGSGFYRKDC